jgi:folate-binding protein YgfZ
MAKQSSLSDFHKSNGGVFTERDGWLLPDHFGDPFAEYDAVRSQVGLFDLSDHNFISLAGPDRVSFLQGMISNELRGLKPGQGVPAAFLNVQGKVLADTRVLCAQDSFLVDLWEPLKQKIIEHLNRYLVADEVEIHDVRDQILLSVQGPRARSLLEKVTGTSELPQTGLQHLNVQISGSEVCLIYSNRTAQNGYDLLVPESDALKVASTIQSIGKPFAAAWIGYQAAEILRVEAAIPRYGVDFGEDNLLLETGLDDAVSFTKGCYLGQEVVERIRSRGHVNKRLVAFIIDGSESMRAGDLVFSGDRQVGTITSSVRSPALGHSVALGYVQRGLWTTGTKLIIKRMGISTAATVSALPLGRAEEAPVSPLESDS